MVSKRILIVFVMLLMAATASQGKVYRFQYQKIVDVEPKLQVTIRNADGNVTVTTNDEYKLKIDAVKNIDAASQNEAEMIAENIQISVAADGAHITVEPKFEALRDRSPSFFQKLLGKSGQPSYGTIDFVISVPTDCGAEISNTSGNIEVAGIRGKLTLTGTAGDVSVRDMAGNLDVSTTSGKVVLKDIEGNARINASGSNITFSALTGNLEVRNSSGSTTGEGLVGDLTITQTTGAVEVKQVQGDIRIKSVSGRVAVSQEFGALDITSESGDVSIKTELNSMKDYLVQTVSGTIEFLIPGSASGRVSLEAESGDIDTQIPIAIDSFSKTRLSGTFGSGGPKIMLATQSGQITMAEY